MTLHVYSIEQYADISAVTHKVIIFRRLTSPVKFNYSVYPFIPPS